MPLFKTSQGRLEPLEQTNFADERQLHDLIQRNLAPVFNCRLVASEFTTGATHGGRIDTLALSEDSNPVIIEYKKVESSELINQSLFYLAWMDDHRGDFEMAVQRALGAGVEVDWSEIRVICIAPDYRKYDLHAVQVMETNIELWRYRYFKGGLLYLEEVFRKTYAPLGALSPGGKNPVMVAAGKKAAVSRRTGTHTFEQHLKGKPQKTQELARAVQEYVLGLDPAMTETPKKFYVAYKISQNIVCMELRKREVVLNLKLDPAQLRPLPPGARDMTRIGHYGTGNLQVRIRSMEDLEASKGLIEMAYQKVGG